MIDADRLSELMSLPWDTVDYWLNAYGEEGAKARGIAVKASRSKPVSANQLPLFGGL